MDKKGLVESNVGKAVLALILLVVLMFIIYLARKQLASVFDVIKNALM
jgi:hypothetical protein